MNKRGREVSEALVAEAVAAGARDAEVVQPRRGHPRLVYWFHGVRRVLAFPGSPSDYRSLRNSVADLRRQLREVAVR